MSAPKAIARQLMRWVTLRPPVGRADWALAMQREFEALEDGELPWAIGCFTTMAGWKLRADWLYLTILFLVPFLLNWKSTLEFQLLLKGIVSRSTFVDFMRTFGPAWALLSPLPIAVLLGAYRPRNPGTTMVVGCLLSQHVVGTLLTISIMGGSFFDWWGPNATLYMAPPLLGLMASLCVWFVGARTGAYLRSRR